MTFDLGSKLRGMDLGASWVITKAMTSGSHMTRAVCHSIPGMVKNFVLRNSLNKDIKLVLSIHVSISTRLLIILQVIVSGSNGQRNLVSSCMSLGKTQSS